jgi:hypothetical protein
MGVIKKIALPLAAVFVIGLALYFLDYGSLFL